MATSIDSTHARAPSPFLPMPPVDIRPAASLFHEAGRLVAAWWTAHRSGRTLAPCHAASFVADPTIAQRMFEWAREDKRAGNDALARSCEARVREALVVAYAAPAAEARHLGVDVEETLTAGDMADADEAGRIAVEWFRDGPATIAACDEAERIARALVQSPAGWAAIETVADALQHRGELDGREISAMCIETFDGEPHHDAWALR